MWWHRPLKLALRRQRRVNLYDFDVTLVYKVSYMLVRAIVLS